jgi:hypothetical protein
VRWFEVSIRIAAPVPGFEVLSSEGVEHLLRVTDVEALSRLLDATRREGGVVLAVWPRRDTLEDMFLREIGR